MDNKEFKVNSDSHQTIIDLYKKRFNNKDYKKYQQLKKEQGQFDAQIVKMRRELKALKKKAKENKKQRDRIATKLLTNYKLKKNE